MDKDGKAAEGTMVGKVAKVATVKGAMPALAMETTLAKEVRAPKQPKGVKRPEPGKVVKGTPTITTSSPVKGPTEHNLASTKRDGKASKQGQTSKGIPIASTLKEKPVAKPAAAASCVPATGGEQSA